MVNTGRRYLPYLQGNKPVMHDFIWGNDADYGNTMVGVSYKSLLKKDIQEKAGNIYGVQRENLRSYI